MQKYASQLYCVMSSYAQYMQRSAKVHKIDSNFQLSYFSLATGTVTLIKNIQLKAKLLLLPLLLQHLFTGLFQDNLGKPAPEKVNHCGFYWSEMMAWQSYQVDHMQIIYTSLQRPHHSVFTGRMPFLPPNHQHQSTEGKGKQSTLFQLLTKQKLK